MRKFNIFAVFGVMLAVFSALPLVFAATPTGANITQVGSGETYTVSPENATANAGYVYNYNISGYSVTGRWAGFYGHVEGGIQLADASGNVFMKWTVSDPSGASVYACDAEISDWSTLAAAAYSDMYSWLNENAADNWNNTFLKYAAETNTWAGNSITANYTKTYAGGSESDDFKTFSLKADSSTLVWATKAVNNENGFNGNQVDFQLLVPANSTGIKYYFYLEIA